MSEYKVYLHVFENGKKYVGITKQEPKKRWNGGLRGYKECPKMAKAIQKYGWENVAHLILVDGLEKEDAERLEIELIKEMNSIKDGYNIEHGGNCAGTHNMETRAKISAGNKGKKKPPLSEEQKEKIRKRISGEGNPFKGKHHTEETKRAHSEFMKGNQYNKGNHHSEDFKKMKSKQMSEKYSNGGNPRCVCVYSFNCENGNIQEFYSLREAARFVGCSPSTLLKKINGEREYKGRTWRYAK